MHRLWRDVGWTGALVLAVLASWMLWSLAGAARADLGLRPALPYLLCPPVLVAGVVAGMTLRRHALSPGMPVALLVTSCALVLGAVLVVEPGKAPLGYANANAAMAVQLAALAGLALLARPTDGAGVTGREADRGSHALLVATILLAASAVVLNRSAAGVAVVLQVLLAVAIAVRRRPTATWWRLAATGLGALTCAVAGTVIVQAARAPAFPGWAVAAFDPVREQLWHDAVALWRAQPLAGSGPGSFAQSTSLSRDPDTLAAHSSVLQLGAETGWVGVGFLALVGLAGLLWVARGNAAEAVVGAAAWTALFVHSTADHLVEFGPVVLLAGAVVGWAGASARSEELDVTERERPLPG
ncbi:hypothetical protein N798_15655 [Knoellia flava TL1]|uniref:O-antigen ligase-related domain-containing protein n=2 Tax=Knoellia flava TaxID=913969 RepID=A0A8H9KPH9_9MICO|nr:O-antigen ligase family protein [Knoellia flava]KGN29047.1 hypothetical protein N798_15655 [Knoellia flava TL1]GGB69996.1 hypothetical protein GCM10011314_06640 [Knoellia flava]